MAHYLASDSHLELRAPIVKENTGFDKSDASQSNKDAIELARIGKREALKRRFGLTSTVGFACSIMLTWEAMIMNIQLGLMNGGPAGLVYGYIAVWIGFVSIFLAMGELASMFPSAGGQYHWAFLLAPKSSQRFLSHVTGSICILAWTAGPTATVYLAGSVLQSAVAMNVPEYDPQGWHVTFIMWGILLICTVLNTWLGMILPVIEVFILIIHVLGFFAVLIPLVYLGPRADPRAVFTLTFNFGGWHDITLATLVGLKGTVAAFLGTDGAVHMAEEVANSSLVVPQSMLFAILINGTLGFGILIAFLFTAGDLSALIESNAAYPFMDILASSTKSKGAAIVLSSMVAILQACAGVGAISSGSRMLWSFSRERAIPGWRWIRQVNSRTSVPFHSTCVIVVAAGLLSLINIGSSVVLNIILSLVLEGFFASYLISLSLLLYRRMRSDIADPREDGGPGRKPFLWGPFRLKGWIGLANNVFAIIFTVIMMFFGCWPPKTHPSAADMNYSIVIFGGVTILAVVYYLGWARKHYHGPVIEV
ncbi:amino acid transporter [Aspergillus steynii IBT 23096]|uniref:Amino acid transporter n=1 Tax=Aspergillus steynii IBT 23096 TaxID=1392250 RepID=A0A2I2GIV2_9EURO|nr:amino acid transporter [Aspergillus steynii IBT 23096]PLB52816.1 amino acid transporter [Aspergillus steynii IBT 23096]